MGATDAVKLFGTDEPSAARIELKAGPITALFENGALRYVRYNGVEAIRAVDYLVRDRGWGTPPALLSEPVIETSEDGCRLTFEGRVETDEIDYRYTGEIVASATGGLRFTVKGEAARAFETNRTGFCILHPIKGVAGAPVTVEHTGGDIEETRFPKMISPSQPIFDVRSLRHEAAPGLFVTCRMEAELPHDPAGKFEMEDQRNWSDASYKTYVCSLLDAVPYTIPAGRTFEQTITLTFEGGVSPEETASMAADRLEVGAPDHNLMPLIGVGLTPGSGEVLDLVQRLGPGHLTVYADLEDRELAATLGEAAKVSAACGAEIQLELVLPCTDSHVAELARAASLCRAADLEPATVIACPKPYLKSYQPSAVWPDVPDLGDIYAACRTSFPKARIGGGMLSYLTEFNRKRPPCEPIDFISHTTTAIVHAADDTSVMETIECLPQVAGSARAICPVAGYRVGPSGIGMRHNPYGAATVANPANQRLTMAAADPRQRGLFGAAWTLACAASLVEAGCEALALSHTTGPLGVIVSPSQTPRPWFDQTPEAVVYPAFHVLRGLALGVGRPRMSIDAGAFVGVGWKERHGTTIWLANLQNRRSTLQLDGAADALTLDATSFQAACKDADWLIEAAEQSVSGAIDIEAYAVMRLRLSA